MRFEELLVGELDWLSRLARRYSANSADAEDLMGETICRLLESKDRFCAAQPFRPWAKTVMLNVYITAYNRQRCVLMRQLDFDCPYSGRSDTEAEINSMLSVIRMLAKRYVSVKAVGLYAVRGLSYDETAKAMGVSVAVVRTRIAVGRRIIKNVLGARQFTKVKA